MDVKAKMFSIISTVWFTTDGFESDPQKKKKNILGKSGKFIMLSRFHGDENASVYASVSCAETREADRMVPIIYGFCKAFALFIAVYFNRKRLLGGRIDTLEMWLTSSFHHRNEMEWVKENDQC